MVVSYRDKRTREFAAGKRVKPFSGIERSAQLMLDRLEAAVSLKDLAALPRNRLEALIGDRKGQYSIRINDQWRICFEWPEGSAGPVNVEIVDSHYEEAHGTACDSPRRTACRRTECARHQRRGARAPPEGADEPGHRDLEWPARHYRRHCTTPRPFLRYQPRILAESTVPLRAAPGRAEGGKDNQGFAQAQAPEGQGGAPGGQRMTDL